MLCRHAATRRRAKWTRKNPAASPKNRQICQGGRIERGTHRKTSGVSWQGRTGYIGGGRLAGVVDKDRMCTKNHGKMMRRVSETRRAVARHTFRRRPRPCCDEECGRPCDTLSALRPRRYRAPSLRPPAASPPRATLRRTVAQPPRWVRPVLSPTRP